MDMELVGIIITVLAFIAIAVFVGIMSDSDGDDDVCV